MTGMLHEKLAETLDKAATDSTTPLYQFIVGPQGSGRTTQARDYAAEIVARGFGNKTMDRNDFATISFTNLTDTPLVVSTLADALGGVLIVEGLAGTGGAPSSAQKVLHDRVIGAIDKRLTTIVFTSSPRDLADALRDMPELGKRLRTTINLTQTFTPGEIEAYKTDKAAGEMRRRRIAEWKTARDEDLHPKERHAAPQTARFTKPGAAS